MMKLHGAIPKEGIPLSDPSMEFPRNWRSELGTSWRDIEEAGSVARAIRLRSASAPAKTELGAMNGSDERGTSVKATRWALFRTLRFSIL